MPAVPAVWLEMLQHFLVRAVQIKCAALLPPGAAQRTPSHGKTSVVGGDTGPRPKPGKGSGAVADDRGGDGRAGMDMGITGVLCINELKL